MAKEKVDIYEKFGDFLLNLIQLVVGGIILASVIADKSINQTVLYISAFLIVALLLTVALVLYKLSNKKKG